MRASQARTARLPPDGPTQVGAGQTPAPVVLERYRLERRLGAGAFGTVWLARDERLERPVAVKILPRERVAGGRFEREARAAARLAHPGIVTLYEASVDDDGAYLVSELVRGKTLDALLAAGRLSDRDIVTIGIALCDALAHAHDEGVVHRDVKPSNILVPSRPATAAQVAKLTDFGVARVIGGDSLTMTGDVIGTLAYMAPEQAEGLEAGAPADLYSLALVLYEALTGVNPVLLTSAAQRGRRLGAHLPPLRRQRRDLPRALGAGIDAALRPRPGERGRVADLRAALVAAHDQVADEPGIVTGPAAGPDDGSALTAWNLRAREHPWAPGPGGEAASEPTRRTVDRTDPSGHDHRDADAEHLPSAVPTWPARGLGALGAGAAAAWLAAHMLAPAPLPPTVAALIAAALVLVLPRLGWLATVAAVGACAAAQGHAGLGVVAGVALLSPAVAIPLAPTAWPLAGGAPALGLIGVTGLAGAWPALAGQATSAWRRAAIAAAGWLWLLLFTPLAGRGLYLPPWPGAQPVHAWSANPAAAADHVFTPVLSTGLLAPAAVWALAAAVLPFVVRGRSPALDLARAVVWAALLTAATPAAIVAVRGAAAASAIPGSVLGASAAAILALILRWLAARSEAPPTMRRARGAGARFP